MAVCFTGWYQFSISGCQKTRWGRNCEKFCAANCIGQTCFPSNGSCVWGCNPENCINDNCDQDSTVCTVGCKEKRTGPYCDKCKWLCQIKYIPST